VVGGVLAGVRPRFAALGGQVEVVLAHARRAAARPRRLPQEPCMRGTQQNRTGTTGLLNQPYTQQSEIVMCVCVCR
jgi:hypothetical protein